jgi:diguanylate cyclase (GGDEF)-like protein
LTNRLRNLRSGPASSLGLPSPWHLVAGAGGLFAAAALAAYAYVASQLELLLAIVVVAPLASVAVYRLFARRVMHAMELALTDPLTGLGNSRHFIERLERELDRADSAGTPLTLCLVDVDDFKRVNDRYGHPAGDSILAEVAAALRGGEGFRLGGDEFALLLPGKDADAGIAIAEAVLARIAAVELLHGTRVTASAGIATFPRPGLDRPDLVRAADRALYESKSLGKDCARVYSPLMEAGNAPKDSVGRAPFIEAAKTLADAIVRRGAERDEGREHVGDIAARLGARMGLSVEHIEMLRVAGALIDIGKLALPEEVLEKPGPLSEREREAIQRHPQIGFAMLDSLGADPLATWIKHHHERWDGRGYPERIAGTTIPLGSRVLFVADAFHSMTMEQAWRPFLTIGEALAEVSRCSGTQFDPDVVVALVAEYAHAIPQTLPSVA